MRSRRPSVLLLLACAAGSVRAPAPARAQDSGAARVALLELEGAVQPAAQRYLERGLRAAQKSGAALVVLRLDTPGGSLVSLRAMTTAITTSPVPVAVYVAPPGARAASAGFFLLMAADVAAMAPGTNAGAASPVAIGEQPGATEMKKASQDAAALVRSLASNRRRSVSWAERAVTEARSYSAEEALRYQMIDLVAGDMTALLRAIDGKSIRRFDGRMAVLESWPAAIEPVALTWPERLLMVVADPQIAYMLMLLGLLGVLLELTHPGAVAPGVIGTISLLLAFYGFSVLPVSWTGALLIMLGIAFLVAEPFVISHGLLAIGGILAFVLGSSMLIDTAVPGLGVRMELIVPAALLLAAITLFLLTRALRLRAGRPLTGLESMIGELGELASAVDPDHASGKVFVHGEYWNATAHEALPAGTRVRVEAIHGSTLQVARAPELGAR